MSLITEFRPKSFKDFYGNKIVVYDLVKKLKAKRPPRSILFAGPSGTGKTTLARIFAHKVGCTDMSIIERNAANTNGIDTVRADIRALRLKMIGGGTSKTLIFDECHMLTKNAQECLLKDTEEPPAGVYFIFCTTDPASFLPTLRNRCSIYQIKPLSAKESESYLVFICEKAEIDIDLMPDDVFDAIIEKSAGVPRNILKMVDQISSVLTNTKISEDKKTESCLEIINNIVFIDDSPEVFEISQLLFSSMSKQVKLKKVQNILFKLRSENINVEAARRGVLGYINAVMLNPKSNDKKIRYCLLLSAIFSESTFNTGFAGFSAQCIEASIE